MKIQGHLNPDDLFKKKSRKVWLIEVDSPLITNYVILNKFLDSSVSVENGEIRASILQECDNN